MLRNITSGPATNAATPLRVAGVVNIPYQFNDVRVTVMKQVMDLCTAAEERARVRLGTDTIPSALVSFNFSLCSRGAQVIEILATEYPALVRSLQVVNIASNDDDESAALAAFAELATDLRELTFDHCCITSVQGLQGRCEYLTKVNLFECYELTSIEGLEDHARLEEVLAALSAIDSVEPLRTCPALIKTDLSDCKELSSIEGLEDHLYLKEVILSDTPIASVEPLRTCPALTEVHIDSCEELSSMDALEDHQNLAVVDASFTQIATIKPLRTCPALIKVILHGCNALTSVEGLEGHPLLKEVDVSGTSIASIAQLLTCPALTKVSLRGCKQLPAADVDLPASVQVN